MDVFVTYAPALSCTAFSVNNYDTAINGDNMNTDVSIYDVK